MHPRQSDLFLTRLCVIINATTLRFFPVVMPPVSVLVRSSYWSTATVWQTFARLSAVLVEPLMSDCKGRFRYGNSAGDCLVEFLLNGIQPRLSNELATDVFRPAIDAYRYGFAAPLDIRVVMLARGEV